MQDAKRREQIHAQLMIVKAPGHRHRQKPAEGNLERNQREERGCVDAEPAHNGLLTITIIFDIILNNCFKNYLKYLKI